MPDFASNPSFVAPLPEPSDQYEGQPTKVAMTEAQRANGFVPDQPIAAEHLNAELNAITAAAAELQAQQAIHVRREMARAALCLRRVTTITAAYGGVGVCSMGPAGTVMVATKDKVIRIGAGETGDQLPGNLNAFGGNEVTSLARNPATGRLVAATSHTVTPISTNSGVGWSAGGMASDQVDDILWNPVHGRFQAVGGGGNAYYGADGTAWTTVVTPHALLGSGLALLKSSGMSAGNVVACGAVSGAPDTPQFIRTTNGGTSWAATGGTVANAAGYAGTGYVCGNADGDTIWHAGRVSDRVVVSKSPDGTTWTTVLDSDLNGRGAHGTPRIMCCPDTGLLVVVVPDTVSLLPDYGFVAIASFDGGVTWTEPQVYVSAAGILPEPHPRQFGVAQGRLIFMNIGDAILASDGWT